ncbi:uncharacterized protein LOC130628870 [Hydractinia symbiolongicarpus]|uniref:uncharacterized protein LOC130628870 n=1 Tax=Hydractinia symbiolongicarpus TaxID=13093 RepID=UPI00255076A1|nr:uncharacterized protein LOC130628870 [Hydractinia symbiolongicarpus]
MSTATTRKSARRKGLRSIASTLRERIDVIVKDFSEEKRAEIISLQTTLIDTVKQLKELDEELYGVLSAEEIETDVMEATEFYLLVNMSLATITTATGPHVSATESTRSVEKKSMRLPKIELSKFNGNSLNWPSFWDQFNSAINDNDSLNAIDKFNYLKRYVEGTALSTISGLELTNSNYENAIELLRNRFGNEQVLINAHMEALLKIESVRSMDNTQQLRKLYNDVENCIRNLKNLKYNSEMLSLLIPVLNERIPNELRMIISRNFGEEKWSVEKMLFFINNELQARERCTVTAKGKGQTPSENYKRGGISTADCLLTLDRKKCVFCHDSHSPSRCSKVTNVQTRSQIMKKEGRCFFCLQHGHISKNCCSNYICNRCGRRHHISLCMKEKRAERKDKDNNGSEENPSNETNANHISQENKGILLQTAKAFVSKERESRNIQTRFMFDSGSQRTYVTNELKEKLNLETIRKEKLIINTFGHSNSQSRELPVVKLYVKTADRSSTVPIEAIAVPNICAPLSNQNAKYYADNYEHLKRLKLADFSNGETRLNVHVLIGLDHYYSFVTGEVVRDPRGGPIAINSKLGWILSGGEQSKANESSCMEVHACRVDTENTILRDELNKFWQIESIGDGENENVLSSFKQTLEFNGERYVTELPFRPDHDKLSDNFAVSKQRLDSLVNKRLRNEPDLAVQYNDVFADYESKQIIEKVPESEIACENAHYLPHHPVVRQDKSTTKVRPVFDGSCAIHKPSLNDILYSGPNLLAKVFDILLRFRTNYVALVADIQQAFLNIEIAEKDRNNLLFLWKENPTENDSKLIIYRFLRVVFGLTCSPFLLNGTIQHHLETYEIICPEITDVLKDDLYVDDLTTGTDTVTEGKKLYEISKQIMKEGGFNLRKWATNNNELQTFIDKIENVNSEPNSDKTVNPKVLGIEWDIDRDILVYRFDELLKRAKELFPTKRNILRISASFYDPLGLIAPITTKVKVLFQKCCQHKSDWDDPLQGELLKQWRDILNDFANLQTFEIPRYLFCEPRHEIQSIELHGFCDSSTIAYAAVIYAKIRTNLGVSVSLVTAKTKVAPLKPHSVPRLELLGCALLAKLMSHVLNAINGRLKVDRFFGWSDSEVALCWLKGKLKQWKPWVENRVVYVRSVIPSESWFHVSTIHNPSDIPTRPDKIGDFNSNLWLNGPEFLSDFSFVPPEFHVNKHSFDVLSEEKKSHVTTNISHSTHHCHSQLHDIIDETKFSSLKKLITTIGYVYRFANKLLNRIRKRDLSVCNDRELSTQKYKSAFDILITNNQRKLRNNQNYFNKLSSALKLFEDEKGDLRVKGRFGENKKLSYDERYPLILSSDSHFTKLLVEDAHEKTFHQGVEAILNMLRMKFWIPKGRRTIKSILRQCIVCRRYQGKPIKSPPTPDLPEYRYCASRAFEHVGFDHAGPLYIRTENRNTKKVYVLILTCATTRAVHFELSPDLKAPAFIRAFKRFQSRRGTPATVVHDNFKTFKSNHVKRFMRHESIETNPILPKSPWWGGFYERIVRSMKTALRKTIGKALLTFEELETVLCQVEASINSRPLTYPSEDDLGQTITPLHLIYGSNIVGAECVPMNDTDQCSKRLLYVQRVLDDQWRRFYQTYLNELRQHHFYRKDGRETPDLKLNDVVVVKDDNQLPRSRWPLGKVTELIYGKDGFIRGAKIRVNTKKGLVSTITRPIQKLIPLEIANETENKVEKVEKSELEKPAEDTLNEDEQQRRPTRKAAVEGQLMRKLREEYL